MPQSWAEELEVEPGKPAVKDGDSASEDAWEEGTGGDAKILM